MQIPNNEILRCYVSCPVCAFTLIQATSINDGIIKCLHCHKRIYVEIIDGKVSALLLHDKKS